MTKLFISRLTITLFAVAVFGLSAGSANAQAAGPLRAIVFLAAEAVLVATYVRLWQEAYAFLTRGQTVSQSAPDIEASLAVQH